MTSTPKDWRKIPWIGTKSILLGLLLCGLGINNLISKSFLYDSIRRHELTGEPAQIAAFGVCIMGLSCIFFGIGAKTKTNWVESAAALAFVVGLLTKYFGPLVWFFL